MLPERSARQDNVRDGGVADTDGAAYPAVGA